MATLHLIGGVAVLVTNLVAGAWGAAAWVRNRPAILPLVVSLLAETVRAGAAERELEGLDFDALPKDRQRLIALAIVRREMGIMTVSALIVLFLALRAAGTSGALF